MTARRSKMTMMILRSLPLARCSYVARSRSGVTAALVKARPSHGVLFPYNTTRSFAAVTAPSSNHKHSPLPTAVGSVIYTETDEAPALATYSLYPVVAKVRTIFSTYLVVVSRTVSRRSSCLGSFYQCLF
jgi:hypothetical protein